MKSLLYFLVLLLSIAGGYILSFYALAPVFLALNHFERQLPDDLYSSIFYAITLLQFCFAGFLFYRIYICYQDRKIVIPTAFSGSFYIANVFSMVMLFITGLGTYVLYIISNAGAVSGVPFGLLLLPASILAFVTVLRCEIPEIKQRKKNHSNKALKDRTPRSGAP